MYDIIKNINKLNIRRDVYKYSTRARAHTLFLSCLFKKIE